MCPDASALAPAQARGMTTTELITPPRAPSSLDAGACPPPTFAEVLRETLPLIGVIPVAGPPVIVVAGPWLLFGLMLAGPFALLLTVVVFYGAAAALVRLAVAVLALPYRLVHELGGLRARRPSLRVPPARLVVRRGAA
jgi:hypothetical protein